MGTIFHRLSTKLSGMRGYEKDNILTKLAFNTFGLIVLMLIEIHVRVRVVERQFELYYLGKKYVISCFAQDTKLFVTD